MNRVAGKVALVTGAGMGRPRRLLRLEGRGAHADQGCRRALRREALRHPLQFHPSGLHLDTADGELPARSRQAEEERAKALSRHPIGFLGEPNDIAYMVLYLASDESKFVTGSEMVVDGGYLAV